MPYAHLSPYERGKIHILSMQGESPAAIGRKLGRHRCTIGRELKRNGAAKRGYHPEKAQQRYHAARKDCVKKRSLDYPPLRAYVYEKITDYWPPEQVCGRARTLFSHDPRMHVASETIYRALYRDERLGNALIPCLRQRRKKRRPRGMGLDRRGPCIPNRVSIEQRPKEVEQRQQCGHWEGDTIVGKNHRGAVATLVESMRTERGPRQRIVAYLGLTDEAGRMGVMAEATPGTDIHQGVRAQTAGTLTHRATCRLIKGLKQPSGRLVLRHGGHAR